MPGQLPNISVSGSLRGRPALPWQRNRRAEPLPRSHIGIKVGVATLRLTGPNRLHALMGFRNARDWEVRILYDELRLFPQGVLS